MCIIIGASLSEPHIDELNVRNLYIIIIIMVRTSPARRYRDCTGVRDIFQHDLEAAWKHLRLARDCRVGHAKSSAA